MKTIHYISKIRSDGASAALCFVSPRPINFKIANGSIRKEAVTCKKCKAIIATLGAA